MGKNSKGSKEFDLSFKKMKDNGLLTWYPWIGKKYSSSERKILIVAESLYSKNDGVKIAIAKDRIMQDTPFIRRLVVDCPINQDPEKANKMFSNLNICLADGSVFDTVKIWDSIAFYDFVQRPMDYNGRSKERPTEQDWISGWETFVEIVKIIKPTDCIFVGVGASDRFNKSMNKLEMKYNSVVYKRWNNSPTNTYVRIFSLLLNDYSLNCVAIQHTSSHFNYSWWNRMLKYYCKDAMKFLYKLIGKSK